MSGWERFIAPSMADDLRWLRQMSWRSRWWSLRNWWNGYRFCPVGRCRYCDHTTPYHYPVCRTQIVEASGGLREQETTHG